MEKFEKILKLLEKDSLSDFEKEELIKYADTDDEIDTFIKVYKLLDKAVAAKGHLPTDLIASYVLYKKGEDTEDKIIPILKNKISVHLSECSECRDEYNVLVENYDDINIHLEKNIIPSSNSKDVKRKNILHLIDFKFPVVRYAFATMIFLIVGYFGLFFISESITPDYKQNIFSGKQNDFYKTRGRTSVLFQQGLNFIEKGKYGDAIKSLTKDIREHENEKSIFYTYYIIGITYLKDAESAFIGLFKSYDNEKVNQAIKYLNISIEKNESGSYENLNLDSYYYLGLAYLLKDDESLAKQNLQNVIDGKGRFINEAENLIKQLEKN